MNVIYLKYLTRKSHRDEPHFLADALQYLVIFFLFICFKHDLVFALTYLTGVLEEKKKKKKTQQNMPQVYAKPIL